MNNICTSYNKSCVSWFWHYYYTYESYFTVFFFLEFVDYCQLILALGFLVLHLDCQIYLACQIILAVVFLVLLIYCQLIFGGSFLCPTPWLSINFWGRSPCLAPRPWLSINFGINLGSFLGLSSWPWLSINFGSRFLGPTGLLSNLFGLSNNFGSRFFCPTALLSINFGGSFLGPTPWLSINFGGSFLCPTPWLSINFDGSFFFLEFFFLDHLDGCDIILTV